MNFTVRPIPAVRTALLKIFRASARVPCLLLSILLGLCLSGDLNAANPPNVAPATRQFEVPQDNNPFHREQLQREAQENMEHYRFRLSLPAAAFDNSSPVRAGRFGALPADAPTVYGPRELMRDLPKYVWLFFGILVWVLIAKKLAPEVLESLVAWVRSKTSFHTVPTRQLVTLLAEEKAVAEFQAALRVSPAAEGDLSVGNAFAAAAEHVREILRSLQEAARGESPAHQRRYLLEAIDRLQPLKTLTASPAFQPLRQMTCALELFVKQLTEKAANVTSSTLRTATVAATTLEDLCQPNLSPDLLTTPPLRVLAVDDETFSRFALAHSLKRGLNEPDMAERADTALELATRNTYDLIVLDVQMPGMDGFELCSKIHETAANRATPVIFVTSLRDFDTRANSLLCGGRDLIAKPFLTFELTVKALALVVNERLRGRGLLAETAAVAPTIEAAVEPAPAVKVWEAEPAPPVASLPEPLLPEVAEPAEAGPIRPQPASAFFASARKEIKKARKSADRLLRVADRQTRLDLLGCLFVRINAITARAESAGQHSIALATSSLEALLKKLLQEGAEPSDSAAQSVVNAIALIQDLCLSEARPDLALDPPIRVLAADDEPLSLRAISSALQRTFSKPDTATGGKSAIALAGEKSFDVIFLDVQMPDVDGFEVCARMRGQAANHRTPVVFVTSHDATAMRTAFADAGGADFLTKPFIPAELDLKALTFALRKRLSALNLTPVEAKTPALEPVAV